MTSDKWRIVVEGIGIIAIVSSLALVAVELKQNTEMMRSQTRATVTEHQLTYLQEMSDPGKLDLVLKYFTGEASFPPPEPTLDAAIFYSLTIMLFRTWENEYYQYQQGLFEEEEFLPRINTWSSNLSNQATREIWQSFDNGSYAPGFADILDSIILEIEGN